MSKRALGLSVASGLFGFCLAVVSVRSTLGQVGPGSQLTQAPARATDTAPKASAKTGEKDLSIGRFKIVPVGTIPYVIDSVTGETWQFTGTWIALGKLPQPK